MSKRPHHPLISRADDVPPVNRRPPLVITVPGTFDRRVTPNGGKEWNRHLVNRLATEMKDRANMAALEVVQPDDRGQCYREDELPLTIHIAVAWEPYRQRMDKDNIIASCKHFLDAIAEVIGVNDKHFEIGTVVQDRDARKAGYIRFAIEPAVDVEGIAA